MSLSRFIAAGAVAALVGSHALTPNYSAQLTAADAMLAVANKKIGELQKERALLSAINDANLLALESVKADLERQAAITEKAQATAKARAADLKTALKRTRNVPKTFDGPIAPVLRRELDDMRADSVRPSGAGDAPADATGDGGADADQPGQPDVPGAPPTS